MSSLLLPIGQLVEFRTGFGKPLQRGRIADVGPHHYKIHTLAGGTCTIQLGGKGRKGTVQAIEEVVVPLPPITPVLRTAELRVVRIDRSGLVAQPRPRARFRCPVYLAYVRARPCCACGLPGPSDPHHAGPRGVGQTADDCTAVPLCRPCHRHVTDTNALPGLTLEYSRVRLLEAQVQLLSEWVAGQEELVADHVEVPVLKRCAS